MARPPSGENILETAKAYLASAITAEEKLRAQTVLLPLENGLSLDDTAQKLGISKFRVCRLRTEFIKTDGNIRERLPRGGRRYENISLAEEATFIAPFIENDKFSPMAINDIKEALELKLGRKVALASVYNLLQRHGWCKTGKDALGVKGSNSRSFLTNRINVINIDSRLPNLALEKVKKFYLDKGFIVESQTRLIGKIPSYVSVLFENNRHKVTPYEGIPDTYIGGTGYDAKIKLPPEVDVVKPRINLGYTTRGCNRSCPFCLVHIAEGGIHIVGDIYDIWDGMSKTVTLLDNNILQTPEHFKLICGQAQKEGLTLDFNQGLDFRLINDDIAMMLEGTRLKDVRLALDSPKLIPQFKESLETLRKFKIRRDPLVYVLVGFDTSWDEDMERILFLKSQGCRPYVQRYKTVIGISRYSVMAEWCNQFWTLQKMSFEEFEKIRKERPDKKKSPLLPGASDQHLRK